MYLATVSGGCLSAISSPALIAVCVISLNSQEDDLQSALCNPIDIKLPYIQIYLD